MEEINVPEEITVYRRNYKTSFIFFITLLTAGIVCLFTGDTMFYIGIGPVIFSVIIIIGLVRDTRDNEPHIILNNKGIYTRKAGFVEWKNTSNEWAGFSKIRYHMGNCLMFDYTKDDGTLNKERVDMNGKNYSAHDLKVFLEVFKERYH